MWCSGTRELDEAIDETLASYRNRVVARGWMVHVEERSHEEVAGLLDIPIKTLSPSTTALSILGSTKEPAKRPSLTCFGQAFLRLRLS